MKQTILLVTEHDRNTILAALRFYQQSGMSNADNLSPELLSVATDDGKFPVMDEDEIDVLCETKINFDECNVAIEDLIAAIKTQGVPFSAFINTYAAPADNPFAKKARELSTDDIESDDNVVLSKSENGAFALCWRWISNAAAGYIPNADLLEEVFNVASEVLKQGADSPDPVLDLIYCDWLEDLITNYADELDEIEDEVVKNVPGQISWLDENHKVHHFMASSAIFRLIQIAKQGGLSVDLANQADAFASCYGNKLDCILTVIQTD